MEEITSGKEKMENIQAKVIEVVQETLDTDKEVLTPETDLRKDLDMDELYEVELTMALESEFGIEIPDEDIEKLLTIKDIVVYIEGKKK